MHITHRLLPSNRISPRDQIYIGLTSTSDKNFHLIVISHYFFLYQPIKVRPGVQWVCTSSPELYHLPDQHIVPSPCLAITMLKFNEIHSRRDFFFVFVDTYLLILGPYFKTWFLMKNNSSKLSYFVQDQNSIPLPLVCSPHCPWLFLKAQFWLRNSSA